mmetsp:Transcript_45982/g.75284  ORF Transcript_45982/g.75284 Transcript_45982/m.75284 type:complete len:94 (+) Transcript_45982:154-435(+)
MPHELGMVCTQQTNHRWYAQSSTQRGEWGRGCRMFAVPRSPPISNLPPNGEVDPTVCHSKGQAAQGQPKKVLATKTYGTWLLKMNEPEGVATQ